MFSFTKDSQLELLLAIEAIIQRLNLMPSLVMCPIDIHMPIQSLPTITMD